MRRNSFWYIDACVGFLSLIGASIAALALAIIVGSVAVEVVSRSLLKSPTIWAVEVATYSLIISGFLGSAYVLRQGRHLEVSLFIDRLTPKVKSYIGVLTDIAAVIFCVIVVLYAIRFVGLSRMIGAVSVSELRVPLWLPQMAVPAGFALLALEFFSRILVRLGLVSGERVGVSSTEGPDHI